MKKSTKITLSLLCILVTVFSSTVPAFAALPENNTVQPMWDNISYIHLGLNFDGTHGNACGTAIKEVGATSIEGIITMYRLEGIDWVYFAHRRGAADVGSLGISLDFVAHEGVMYKAVFEVTAYRDGVGETFTVHDIRTCE